MKVAKATNGNVFAARRGRINDTSGIPIETGGPCIVVEVFNEMFGEEVVADWEFEPDEARDLIGALVIALEKHEREAARERGGR